MLIDFHTHCFPDKIASKAIEKLSFVSGGLTPYTDGTVAGLKESMKKCGVDVSVVLNIATNAHQQTAVNDFAASINNKKDIFSFGSVSCPDVLITTFPPMLALLTIYLHILLCSSSVMDDNSLASTSVLRIATTARYMGTPANTAKKRIPNNQSPGIKKKTRDITNAAGTVQRSNIR